MMRDIDTINDALDDARAVLHSYMWPGPRDPQLVLQRMLEILDPKTWALHRSARARAASAFGS